MSNEKISKELYTWEGKSIEIGESIIIRGKLERVPKAPYPLAGIYTEASSKSSNLYAKSPNPYAKSPASRQIENPEILAASMTLHALANTIMALLPEGIDPRLVKQFVNTQKLPAGAVEELAKFFEAVVNSHRKKYDLVQVSLALLQYAAIHQSGPKPGNKMH